MKTRSVATQIHPLHSSIQKMRSEGKGVRPKDMEKVTMPTEMRDGLFDITLSIFADCVNVGTSFQDSLLAIYLSGLQHGQAIARSEVQP